MSKLLIYSTIATLYLIFGLFTGFFPQKGQDLLKIAKEKKLFFLFGIFEVVVSLLVLYFRYDTIIPMLITITGLLLFIDGILYMLGTKVLNETFDIILEMEIKSYRYYSLIFFFYALIIYIGLI